MRQAAAAEVKRPSAGSARRRRAPQPLCAQTLDPAKRVCIWQAAAADVEAERGQRAEAQGVSEQLKADGARRSRVFRNAVDAAVRRIQAELEEERDGLAARSACCLHLTLLELWPVCLRAGRVSDLQEGFHT